MKKENVVKLFRHIGVLFLFGAFLLVTGCAREEPKVSAPPKAKAETHVHDHSGWWCDEHGMPEEVCARCNKKLANKLKKKGDWCEEHDRPKSICFLCDPKKQEHWAAVYRDKMKKEPPAITEP